jgi:hypothetical protein
MKPEIPILSVADAGRSSKYSKFVKQALLIKDCLQMDEPNFEYLI